MGSNGARANLPQASRKIRLTRNGIRSNRPCCHNGGTELGKSSHRSSFRGSQNRMALIKIVPLTELLDQVLCPRVVVPSQHIEVQVSSYRRKLDDVRDTFGNPAGCLVPQVVETEI